MTRALIIAIYLLFSATIAIAVFLFAGAATGFLSGVVLALGCFQIDSNARNRRACRMTERRIADLTRRLDQALDDIGLRIDDASKVIESRKSVQSGKIMAELQVLESLVRGFAARVPEEAGRVTEISPPRERSGSSRTSLDSPGEGELLQSVRVALEHSRVDLYLQPIVTLPQRKLRFYEALSRLRAEDGSIIMPAQYATLAASAGLMPRVDNLLLFRCVQIVRRLAQKQRDIGVFCNISGDSLIDAEFFPQILEFMHRNRDLAGRVVLEFAQETVQHLGVDGEASLVELAQLGFALSMDQLESLEMDFAKLRRLGFRHIKVRARALLHGAENANAATAAVDLRKHLERYGLNLIAERVEDEDTVKQLLEVGIDFAQGYLFGTPRAVGDDWLRTLTIEEEVAPLVTLRKAS